MVNVCMFVISASLGKVWYNYPYKSSYSGDSDSCQQPLNIDLGDSLGDVTWSEGERFLKNLDYHLWSCTVGVNIFDDVTEH